MTGCLWCEVIGRASALLQRPQSLPERESADWD
jgi:hypothetical protein